MDERPKCFRGNPVASSLKNLTKPKQICGEFTRDHYIPYMVISCDRNQIQTKIKAGLMKETNEGLMMDLTKGLRLKQKETRTSVNK